MSFKTIIDRYRIWSFNTSDQGSKFERLMRSFMLTSSVFNGQGIQTVWLWSEFPYRDQFGIGHDIGIDLVVQTRSGEYWAVQCKCYGQTAQIDKPAVDTFLSSSGKSFLVDGSLVHFSRRLWFDTAGRGLNSNAEESLKSQSPPVSRFSYFDLNSADVDWDKLDEGLFGAKAKKQKYSPRPHQQEAVDNASRYYKDHDRGKLIMACGTGKTYTSLKIVENEIASDRGAVVYLAPSIALVGQTLKEWSEQADRPLHGVCVCSDPKISKTRGDGADDVSLDSIIDLALPASTDPGEIIRQLGFARRLQEEDSGLVVVFSTYQSIDVVSRVQKLMEGKLAFDFCVCDEAHRTTGVTLKDETDSEFVKVHDPGFIVSKKRLYMTATPRLYNDSMKQKAKDSDAVLCSMDDPALYGEEFYRIGFGESVKKGLLSDYKVMILTLNEEEMPEALQNAISTADSEIPTDDSLKLVGCINALSKITKDSELLEAIDPELMHNGIAFCQNIKTSKKMVRYLEVCRDAYYQTLSEEQREGIVAINARHIDGSMGAVERSEKLEWLKDVDRSGNKCNLLMNVRCLSEGVDVPTLDAVLFLSARNSQIDVVQSVGRVMRKAPGKQYGYIIIPVVIPSDVRPEAALDDNKRFSVVWTVLQALRAHDDRFNALVNKIELNKKKTPKILIGGVFNPEGRHAGGELEDLVGREAARQYELAFETFQGAIFAKIVEKCGNRRYWEQWAADVAKIAERHIEQIGKLVSVEGSEAKRAFDRYINGLRKNINPSVTYEDAVEMLAQHFITKPIFEALFEDYSFVENNSISKAMSGIVRILHEQTPKEDTEKLERFYSSVRERCEDLDNGEAKQRIIIELYDKFFKTAFPKTVEKLGIVYTPVEVVDFIINSIEDILQKEFGRSMTDQNVHILDPFTGTGTFIVRLLQSGIIKPEDLGRKYKWEIHACEIVLLAYYIASINIENTYHDMAALIHEKEHPDNLESKYDLAAETVRDFKRQVEYQGFEGIVLTDTFQMTEDSSKVVDNVFPQNSARANHLRRTPITIIFGNPPYSVGQKSANDNARNQHYQLLDSRISKTYAAYSRAANKNSVYDSYIKAFRWSSDRLADYDKTGKRMAERDGIIGFVSNAGWLDGNAMDGMRKCLEKEFSSIYVFNLRGNCRTSGELRRKERDNIFGLGSRTPIAITILVKKKNHSGKAKIYYNAVGDYLTRADKLELCRSYGSVLNQKFKKEVLHPNDHGDWISKRNDKFEEFIEIANKKDKNANTFFCSKYSCGLKTQRDAWCYNYSLDKVKDLASSQIGFYNESVRALENEESMQPDFSTTKISWTNAVLNDYKNRKLYDLGDCKFVAAMYKPFQKQNLLYYKPLNERVYQMDKLFPTGMSNLVICATGIGASKQFSCLIVDSIPCLDMVEKSQCFPLYWYKKADPKQLDLFSDGTPHYERNSGLTDFIMGRAEEKYGSRVTDEDVFYYVYGILNERSYAEKFGSDLKKMLPRLPLVGDPKKFWAFSKAGRDLARLHLGYEDVPPCEGVIVEGDRGNYLVEKMRFPQKGQRDSIVYNKDITIKNIPSKAYEYIVNGKSTIEWIMERYQVSTNKESGITNDPNDWGREHGKPRYILDLLLSVVNVSVQTVDIVAGLPEVDWDKE